MYGNRIPEEEIIRDWSFSVDDQKLISPINSNNRLWFSIELCGFKLFGQFIENPNKLDSRIIAHLCKQLYIPIVATVEIPSREATKTRHKKLIFEHLEFSKFGDSVSIFRNWLDNKVNEGAILTNEILPDAEKFLIQSKIMLPTKYRLKREINSMCFQQQEIIYNSIFEKLPKDLLPVLDEILEVIENKQNSWFQKFKEYPGSATISLLKDYLERYRKINDIDLAEIDFSEVSPSFGKYLYKLGKYYDVWDIKRFRPGKRYTFLLAFIKEARKVLADYIIQMHDQYISNICRECKNIHEKQMYQFKNRNEKAMDCIEKLVDYLLEQEDSAVVNLDEIYQKTSGKELIRNARNDMKKYKIVSKYGYASLLQNRYGSMRRYFSDFLKLPIKAEEGSHGILMAIHQIKELDKNKTAALENNVTIEIIDSKIRSALFDKNGRIKRGLWEVGVAIAIKDGFRSGDIFLPQSNKHVSFCDLIYQEEQWKCEKDKAYKELVLENAPNKAVEKLSRFYNQTASTVSEKMIESGFAEIKNGTLKLSKKDAVDIPNDVKRLQSLISSYLPKIKIEKLLMEVDMMTGFAKHFSPLHGQKGKPKIYYKTLIASIISQATNLGIVTMQDCTTDITVEMMRYVSDAYIREETIKAANAEIVNKHSTLQLSQVYGKGSLSSSDGQRFAVTASSLLSSYYPRYYGYYEQVLGIYTHMSDQFSVYNTNAISCAPRESLYVIDGILDNNTILAIKEHTTDTEGYTEHVFALCYLLGIQFMPRIKNLKSQQLYRIEKGKNFENIDVLLNKTINMELIAEQWDQMVRVVASLKNKLSPAHEVVRRLAKDSPSDKLTKAFTQLGRLVKTEYILRYITDEDLRNKVQRQLNKGEHRHALSRWIFFANQGKFQVGDYEEIMNKASCLSLVSNAVLYWNTVKIGNIIDQLRKNGEGIDNESLSHISLLPYKHVVPMGTYFVDSGLNEE